MATDNKISTLVESQVPGYLLEEGPNLVAFLKAYYEWMETTGQVTEVSKNHLYNRDIDSTNLDKFYEYFRREVLADFPENILADKKLVAKRIKDLYRAKGSTAAYNLLFRILYDQNVSVYKPSENILRASDGRWTQDTIVRLGAPFSGNVDGIVGKIVTGSSSGATGKVLKVLTIFEGGVELKQLRLTEVSGSFIDLEQVTTTSGESGVVVNNIGPLSKVTFGTASAQGGTGHQPGDLVNLTSASGTGATGVVDATSNEVLTFKITNGGSGYTVGNTVVTISGGSPKGGLIGAVTVTAIANAETIFGYSDTIQGLSDTPIGYGPTFSSNSGVISSNLASSNSSTSLGSALGTISLQAGKISAISVTTGNYQLNSIPNVVAVDNAISPLELSDGAGGIKGRNAVITPSYIAGSITALSVTQGGQLYNTIDSVTVSNQTRTASDATGTPVVSGVINELGSYKGTKGFLSWDQRLQDNYYYQEFSYVLRSEIAFRTYKKIVNDVIHPAGNKLFGQIDLYDTVDLTGLDVETNVSTDLIGGKDGVPSIDSTLSFGTDYVVSRVFNLPSITSTAAVPNPIVNMSMVAASIVSTEAFSTDNVLSRDMSLPPIVPTANVSIDNILSRDLFTTSIESTLVVGEPADDVYLLANGYIYVSNNNTITTYLGKPITQHLDDPVIIGTPFVVQGDGSAIFSTIVKGGSQIEIQDIVPGTSGNTTYIVNTVFSNTTFTINTEFTGGNMSNGVFRYIYDGNI
jgi:hypothetical protein